jgi:hypothetical protein
MMSLQIFCGRPPPFSRIPDAATPHSAGPAPHALERSALRLDFTLQLV